jgi:hypothetical protein
VSSTRELILLCYIVFHLVRSAHKFHFQPLKLSIKPAVAVTEAVRFIRKWSVASVEMRQPIQAVEGTVVHRGPAYQFYQHTSRQSVAQWGSRCNICSQQIASLWHKHPQLQYLQVCCFIAYPQYGRFIAQLACVSRDIQWRQLPCSETRRKVHPMFCYCGNHSSSLTHRLVTFSSKLSSNFSHILEVILSQIVVQTLSTVLVKIMATVVTINQELHGHSVQQH